MLLYVFPRADIYPREDIQQHLGYKPYTLDAHRIVDFCHEPNHVALPSNRHGWPFPRKLCTQGAQGTLDHCASAFDMGLGPFDMGLGRGTIGCFPAISSPFPGNYVD